MKRTIFVVAMSIAGFIAVWRFDPTPATSTAVAAPQVSTAPSTSAGSGGATAVTTQGTAEQTDFGTVQVQVTFSGSRITDVSLAQQPDSGRGIAAIPVLREEALQAQSADIDTVSGATQTSESYIKSLQAALDARGS
ncbi:FMN-binding protein [Amycolatopsis rhabdoformis]|uniref:FMN-binding protein n=1 Tax=Amycolatopsis rhabdoformis TaxID=1448059 RepID=A0ABZ1I9H1_9PSEU|nr:FMN-binding protein [Amycolatopsis rhabdoformis]WSE30214.1 FMN-binding protein [Amycolatopsis rhabdoformis]